MSEPVAQSVSPSPLVLAVVGGASGVGKTTVLEAVAEVPKFNTGTLFKNRMSLESRDDIRKSEWSQVEEAVAEDLAEVAISSLREGGAVIIDTHFAAKLNGHLYRVGLKRPLIYQVGRRAFEYADAIGSDLHVFVILINCAPHALLRRRRMDTSRQRELIPSDCLNALRDNKMCSFQYHRELIRACVAASPRQQHKVDYIPVDNDDLDASRQAVSALIPVRKYAGFQMDNGR